MSIWAEAFTWLTPEQDQAIQAIRDKALSEYSDSLSREGIVDTVLADLLIAMTNPEPFLR